MKVSDDIYILVEPLFFADTNFGCMIHAWEPYNKSHRNVRQVSGRRGLYGQIGTVRGDKNEIFIGGDPVTQAQLMYEREMNRARKHLDDALRGTAGEKLEWQWIPCYYQAVGQAALEFLELHQEDLGNLLPPPGELLSNGRDDEAEAQK